MLTSTVPPPKGVMESCEELTAPVEVPVVEAAQAPLAGMPNRTSLPSMFPPDTDEPATASTCWLGRDSNCQARSTEPIHSSPITAART